MNWKHVLIIAVMVSIISACGVGPTSGSAGADGSIHDQATQQFLTERNNGTPVAEAGAGQPTIGIVEQVEGSTLRLRNPITKQETVVQLAAHVTITTQAEIAASQIQPGDELTAMGKQNGVVFEATMVQIGKSGLLGAPMVLGGAPMSAANEGDQTNSQDPATLPMPTSNEAVSGIVEQVEGNDLSIKTADNTSVKVQLTNAVQIRKQHTIKPEQIEAGRLAIVSGTQQGTTFEASSVDLLPAPAP